MGGARQLSCYGLTSSQYQKERGQRFPGLEMVGILKVLNMKIGKSYTFKTNKQTENRTSLKTKAQFLQGMGILQFNSPSAKLH